MASLKTNPLPYPAEVYDVENEQTTRRTIEFALQNIENDLLLAKTQADKDGSLAMRRFQ
jgi:hypothetical protein